MRLCGNLPWLWLAGSPLTFALLACGLIGAERYKRQSRLIESGEIPLLCQRLARALQISRQVVVGVCDRLAAPVLIGILRPVILLPPAAVERLDDRAARNGSLARAGPSAPVG